MGKIKLTGGYAPIPEGFHVFKITEVVWKPDFGKVEVTMVTQDGQKHTEKWPILKVDGSVNTGASNSFSFFARTALRDMNRDEIDPEDLVGHFIECQIKHNIQPRKDDPSKTNTYVNLGEKKQSDGWTEASAKKLSRDALNSLLDD